MLNLTEKEMNVLKHVVRDPVEWFANAEKALGPKKAKAALKQKVARWEPEYKNASKKPGYKNRLERDIEEEKREKEKLKALENAEEPENA